MAEIKQLLEMDKREVPVLNENIRELNANKWEVKYFTTAPTTNSLNTHQLGVYDDEAAVRRLYFKTHAGTLCYVAATVVP